MNDSLASLTIVDHDLVHRQITDQLREKILHGELPLGAKLPATEELSRRWRTHIRNVHAALSTLTKEGLLVRIPRKGTFVRAREKRLARIGIYVSRELCLNPIARYGQEVMSALTERMDRVEIKHDLWMDSRSNEEYGNEWTDLTAALRRQEIQAVIAVSVSLSLRKWLDRLPAPVAYLGDSLPTSVGFNPQQYLEMSLQRLQEQGCRTVGWITGAPPAGVAYFDRFFDLIKQMNLRMKSDWMSIGLEDLRMHQRELYGYERFCALWQQPERPQGLLVEDDTIGRGVIAAILARRVRVPKELKVVFQGSVEIPLLCPFPATFVEGSCGEVAEALLQQVQRSFRGEPCKMIQLPFRMRAN